MMEQKPKSGNRDEQIEKFKAQNVEYEKLLEIKIQTNLTKLILEMPCWQTKAKNTSSSSIPGVESSNLA